MLVSGKALLDHAQKHHYAVGAFNVNNMEIVQAIIQAAEELQAPVILQASQGGMKYAGVSYIAALGLLAAKEASVPVALHLDHGTDFPEVIKCIRHGFSSVMIDGSRFALEENIAFSQRVVEIAHAVDVSVEAELGKIGGTEDHITVSDREATFTDPDEAQYFVEQTGVDSLAIAVGTAHGVYKGEPKIDFDRIRAIREKVSVPLVLHGSSGVPYEALEEAVKCGICKINIDTDIRASFAKAVKEVVATKPDEIDPRKILGPAREAMKEVVKEKIQVFGSAHKAFL